MGCILMQPANDAASVSATVLLLKSGEYLFDTEKPGAHLQPIFFGSRACTGHETQYHSFVGETACGPWAISKNKRYIWGTHFYWLCDCKPMSEILEYDVDIAMISSWDP